MLPRPQFSARMGVRGVLVALTVAPEATASSAMQVARVAVLVAERVVASSATVLVLAEVAVTRVLGRTPCQAREAPRMAPRHCYRSSADQVAGAEHCYSVCALRVVVAVVV